MSEKFVIFQELKSANGKVGLIMLNRPRALNALNIDMIKDINNKLIEWENADTIETVVITASPGRAFCAGGDIRAVYENRHQPSLVRQYFQQEYNLNKRIFHYPKPYIALLDGITMGGGAGISVHGGHCVATKNLIFAMPETGIGYFPDVGATYFLSRLPYHMGYYLGLTGTSIGYLDCCFLGITPFFILPNQLSTLVEEIAKHSVKALSPFSLDNQPVFLKDHQQAIDACFSGRTIEEIVDKLSDYPDEWCHQIVTLLKTKSPMSLKVTLQALQRGEKMDFNACMDMEYQLACHFLEGDDFYEGIRAVLIDKDQRPQWSPAHLEEISEKSVNTYFTG